MKPCNKHRLSRIDALLVVNKAYVNREKPDNNRHEKRIYWCKECKSWHTTHKEKWYPTKKAKNVNK